MCKESGGPDVPKRSTGESGETAKGPSVATAVGGFAAVTLMVLWHAAGPGPMFEEHFIAVFVAFGVGVCGMVAAILDPRPILAPLTFAGIWFLAVTAMWARIASVHDYSFWKSDPFEFAVRWSFILFAFLFLVNIVSRVLRGPPR